MSGIKRKAISGGESLLRGKKSKKRLYGDVRYRVAVPAATVSPSLHRVFVDGACSGNHHRRQNERKGGYGIFFEDTSVSASGTLPDKSLGVTNNRLELIAVVKLLSNVLDNVYEHVRPDDELRVVGDNQYVLNMALDWLPKWRARNYCKADGSGVENDDLVRQLDALLLEFERCRRPLSFQWVRAH